MKEGDVVEVRPEDEGYEGSWFTAKYVKRRGKKVEVLYEEILEEETGQRCLELLKLTQIRPLPPAIDPDEEDDRIFEEGAAVDAFENDGWWTGVVKEVLGQNRYRVLFKEPKFEEGWFNSGQLRTAQYWMNNKWYPFDTKKDNRSPTNTGHSPQKTWNTSDGGEGQEDGPLKSQPAEHRGLKRKGHSTVQQQQEPESGPAKRGRGAAKPRGRGRGRKGFRTERHEVVLQRSISGQVAKPTAITEVSRQNGGLQQIVQQIGDPEPASVETVCEAGPPEPPPASASVQRGKGGGRVKRGKVAFRGKRGTDAMGRERSVSHLEDENSENTQGNFAEEIPEGEKRRPCLEVPACGREQRGDRDDVSRVVMDVDKEVAVPTGMTHARHTVEGLKAYSLVLRHFYDKSPVMSLETQILLTDLRSTLNITSETHMEELQKLMMMTFDPFP